MGLPGPASLFARTTRALRVPSLLRTATAPEREAAGGACVVYRLHGVDYVQLTCRSNATTLRESRGPGFQMPSSSGFAPLPQGYEPSSAEVLALLAGDGRDVVFAGEGEPTLRLGTLLSVARELQGLGLGGVRSLRLTTNGLADLAHGRAIVPDLVAAGLGEVSVAINTSDPRQYERLMRPAHGEGSHAAVCRFVEQCAGAGLATECTAVAAPGVDLAAAEQLAGELGATFRSRTYFP